MNAFSDLRALICFSLVRQLLRLNVEKLTEETLEDDYSIVYQRYAVNARRIRQLYLCQLT